MVDNFCEMLKLNHFVKYIEVDYADLECREKIAAIHHPAIVKE